MGGQVISEKKSKNCVFPVFNLQSAMQSLVVDPGLLDGVPTPKVGALSYYLAKFLLKMA